MVRVVVRVVRLLERTLVSERTDYALPETRPATSRMPSMDPKGMAKEISLKKQRCPFVFSAAYVGTVASCRSTCSFLSG